MAVIDSGNGSESGYTRVVTKTVTVYKTVGVGEGWKYQLGDPVKKKSGSDWYGNVVGFYSTVLTPKGYAVESAAHPGSVQIYPEAALEKI